VTGECEHGPSALPGDGPNLTAASHSQGLEASGVLSVPELSRAEKGFSVMEFIRKNCVEKALAGSGRACLTCSFQAEDYAVLHRRGGSAEDPVAVYGSGYHSPNVCLSRQR